MADSVSEEAKPVAIFHAAHLTTEQMTAALVKPMVMDAAGVRDVVDAIGYLTRRDGEIAPCADGMFTKLNGLAVVSAPFLPEPLI